MSNRWEAWGFSAKIDEVNERLQRERQAERDAERDAEIARTSKPYRVYHLPHGEETYVNTAEEGIALVVKLTRQDLKNPYVVWNFFGMQERTEDGKWVEWLDDNANIVTEVAGY